MRYRLEQLLAGLTDGNFHGGVDFALLWAGKNFELWP